MCGHCSEVNIEGSHFRCIIFFTKCAKPQKSASVKLSEYNSFFLYCCKPSVIADLHQRNKRRNIFNQWDCQRQACLWFFCWCDPICHVQLKQTKQKIKTIDKLNLKKTFILSIQCVTCQDNLLLYLVALLFNYQIMNAEETWLNTMCLIYT